jgi:hypothetical protein
MKGHGHWSVAAGRIEAEGSLTLETKGRAASSPDKAGVGQHCQMTRCPASEGQEGVTTVNQRMKASQERTTSSNLTDMGWVAVRTRAVTNGELFGRSMSPVREAMAKACGVAVAKPQEQSWAPNLSSGSR